MSNKPNSRLVLEAVSAYKKTLDDHRFVGDGTFFNSMKYGITRNTLQVVFKKLYGVNVREYKMRVRMERAHELLKQGIQVKWVSILLHYTTPRAFVTAFKKKFGVSPGRFKDFRQA
jgi:AraC-like DNA-binding protein